METTPGPPEQEKYCINILCPRRIKMHYVTRRSYRMQKHMFIIMCPDALFVKSIPVPPEHEKEYMDVLWPTYTGMHYVTHRSHRMMETREG
jgi:hypothetical protein